MREKLGGMIKNIMYTVVANAISMVISALITLILPKMLGVTNYSYYQLYVFYTSYVGLFHLGWIDGIYLRYGGWEYKKLDHRKFVTQFWMLVSFELLIAIIISSLALSVISNSDKRWILVATCISGVITIAKTFYIYMFEATNRIKEYAKNIKLDRYIFFFLVLAGQVLALQEYEYYVIIDIVAKSIALLFCMKESKELVIGKLDSIRSGLHEAKENISSGIKLMLAYLTGNLIIGIIQFSIERNWSIEQFGKISFTLTISSLLMVFINAIGVIMFPMLKRIDEDKLKSIYSNVRVVLMAFVLGLLLCYYPIKAILLHWLPDYKDSLYYMGILFPISVFESRISILIYTYLKALRKENWILLNNVITLLCSLVTTYITVILCRNIELAVLSIVILLGIRCVISEVYLSRCLKIKLNREIVIELIMIAIFIGGNSLVDAGVGVIAYCIAYGGYILYIKDRLLEVRKMVK